MEWFFDGIGTEIISLVVGLIIGGFGGYKIGAKSKQKQKAKDNANQQQIGSININNGTE